MEYLSFFPVDSYPRTLRVYDQLVELCHQAHHFYSAILSKELLFHKKRERRKLKSSQLHVAKDKGEI